jgi:hypothetical protein
MQFKYLDFSMADVGSVSIFKVNMYNPLVQICMDIFYFHAKIVVRCKNEFFLEFHISVVFNLLYLQKLLV